MPKAAVLILPLFLAACSDTSATAAADGKGPAKGQPVQAAALPSNVSQPEETVVTGTVLETFDAGPYTYLRLKTASGSPTTIRPFFGKVGTNRHKTLDFGNPPM